MQGRYLVRRGQRVQVNLVAMHRQARHWGGKFGDPDSFNPERFMPGEPAEICNLNQALHSHAASDRQTMASGLSVPAALTRGR